MLRRCFWLFRRLCSRTMLQRWKVLNYCFGNGVVVLHFFWLVNVSVVDDWEDILRCCVMMIFWWSRRLRSRTMWKRWGSNQTITLEVLFLLFARWNCHHSSGLDAVVEVFISFQQIPCTIVQIAGARFASKHLIHFLPTHVNLVPFL